jgi:phage host-nuclease inhibitor protein Gam
MTDAAVDTRQDIDLMEAQREARIKVAKIREHLSAIDRLTADYREQIGEIDEWYSQAKAQYDHEVERLKVELRPYVAALTAGDPLDKRSVNLPAGVAGFRQAPDSVEREDDKATLAWLRDNAPELVAVKTTRTFYIDDVKGRFAVKGERFVTPDGEVIPGLRVVPGEDKFYVSTVSRPTPS